MRTTDHVGAILSARDARERARTSRAWARLHAEKAAAAHRAAQHALQRAMRRLETMRRRMPG